MNYINYILNLYYKLPFRPFRKTLAKLFHNYRKKKDQGRKLIAERKGIKFNLDLDDSTQSGIYYGIYKNTITNFMEKILKKGDYVFDIGANIGYLSLIAAKIVGKEGKVYAFEPMQEVLEKLNENMSLNNFNNIIVEKLGISDKSSKSRVEIRTDYSYDKGFEKEEIKFVTLDSFISKNKIKRADFIKIDTDGFGDFEALKGCEETISNYGATVIIKINYPYHERNLKEYHRKVGDYLFYFKDFYIFSDIDGVRKPISKHKLLKQLRDRGALNAILIKKRHKKRN